MDRIYFRNCYKLYVAHETPNRPNQCFLYTFDLNTKEVMYLGYYKEGAFEQTTESLEWDVERSLTRFLKYLERPFQTRSIPGVAQFRFA